MLIAKKLKQDNIAEYLLYMWQIEDIIRANDLDINIIEEQIINNFSQTAETKKDIKDWYEGLIEMMHIERKTDKGHLIINQNIIRDLTDLHLQLLKMPDETDYSATYYKTLPFIVELRVKSQDKDIPELETCFAALYGLLLMRLKKTDISGETQAAISQISALLRLLADRYKKERRGTLELN